MLPSDTEDTNDYSGFVGVLQYPTAVIYLSIKLNKLLLSVSVQMALNLTRK